MRYPDVAVAALLVIAAPADAQSKQVSQLSFPDHQTFVALGCLPVPLVAETHQERRCHKPMDMVNAI